MGRLSSIPSTSIRAVLKASLATVLFCNTDFKVFFVYSINLPNAPPKWGAPGGWKFHSISFSAQTFCTYSSFTCLRHFNSSLFAPTKLVPLSLYILYCLPRRAMNLFKAIVKWSVDRLSTSSGWQALVAMQTNKQPYTLTSRFLRIDQRVELALMAFLGFIKNAWPRL